MNKTKIEWAEVTWNPVTGCLHGCEYCYARRIANRFGGHVYGEARYATAPDGQQFIELEKPAKRLKKNGEEAVAPFPFYFKPTLHRYRLDEPQRWKKPRTIFVCSMADLFGEWVPEEWIKAVFDACEKAPQHRYLFLTKNWMRACQYRYKSNWWVGRTYTHTENTATVESSHNYNLHLCYGLPKSSEPYTFHENKFLSIEPIEGPVTDIAYYANNFGYKWVIIGAETGNRQGKVVPKKEWIDRIVADCDWRGVPVFMKDSLIPIMGEDNMRREFPWDAF